MEPENRDLQVQTLVEAAGRGNLAEVEALLTTDTLTDEICERALKAAASRGHAAVVEKLLRTTAKLNPNVIKKVFEDAVTLEHVAVVEKLLTTSMLTPETLEWGLERATLKANAALVNMLIPDNADINPRVHDLSGRKRYLNEPKAWDTQALFFKQGVPFSSSTTEPLFLQYYLDIPEELMDLQAQSAVWKLTDVDQVWPIIGDDLVKAANLAGVTLDHDGKQKILREYASRCYNLLTTGSCTQKLLAFSMGMHQRLGQNSPVQLLNQDIAHHIGRWVYPAGQYLKLMQDAEVEKIYNQYKSDLSRQSRNTRRMRR